MALREVYDSADDIDEAFRPLYKEVKEGDSTKYVFDTSQFEGGTVIGTKGRLKLQEEAGGYRTKLKEAKTSLEKYTALGTLEELSEKLTKYPELEAAAAAGGSKSKEAIDAQVAARLGTEKTKWEREISPKLQEAERNGKLVQHYENAQVTRALTDAAMAAINDFKKGKLDPGAIEDALMYAERHLTAETERDEETGLLKVVSIKTKDGVGVTPDVDVSTWLLEMVGRKQHWLLGSEGSGSEGSRRNGRLDLTGNPFTYEGWNLGEQGKLMRTDPERAKSLAKAAGIKPGDLRPKPRTKQGAQQP
jgi:hypothetical protein